MYIIVLLLCFFQQNQAFVIPNGVGLFGENNLNSESLVRRSPQIFDQDKTFKSKVDDAFFQVNYEDSNFEHLERRSPQILGQGGNLIPNAEAASFQVNYDDLNFNYLERRNPENTGQNPSFTLGDASLQTKLDPSSFESHFSLNGLRNTLANNIPFSSGNLIDPNSFIRQVDSMGQSVPPPQQHSSRPPMTTETFVMNDSGPLQSTPPMTQNQNMAPQMPQPNMGTNQNLNANQPSNLQQPLTQTSPIPQSGMPQSFPQPGSNNGNQNYPPQGSYNANPQSTLQQTNPLPQSGMSQSFPQSGANTGSQNYLPPNNYYSNQPSTQPMAQNNNLPQGMPQLVPQSSPNGQINYSSQGTGNQYYPPQDPQYSQSGMTSPFSQPNLNAQNYQPPVFNTNQPTLPQVLPQINQLPQQSQMTNPQPTSQQQFPVSSQNLMNHPPVFQTPTSTQSTQFTQQPPNYQTQPQPILRMPSNGVGSNTFASAMNNLPPEVAQQVMAYYNHDASHQQPHLNYQNGNWPASGQVQQPSVTANQGNLPNRPGNQPFNLNDWSGNGKTFDPSNPFPQRTNSFPEVMNQMDNQLGFLTNPSQYMSTLNNMGQSIPGLLNNALASGLRLAEIPLKIPKPFLDNFERDIPDINLKNYLRIPVVTAKALFEGADDVLRILENSLKQLSRRSPDADAEAEAWMFPDLTSNLPNLHSSFNSIPFGTAQDKISQMRNSILNRIPSSLFSQPFSMPSMPSVPSTSSMPQVPSVPNTSSYPSSYPSSGDGQPIVKMSSTSVSESTSAISRNGGPPEVSQQASGLDFNYDSTKVGNPINSDFVAMQGYTPNAYDPSQGTFEAVESSYPQKTY